MRFPTIEEIRRLCRSVKLDISDEYRVDEDSDVPGILLTVGANTKGGWSYQTGDTSFMGGAYHYPHWGQSGIYRDTNCRDAARAILDEIKEAAAMSDSEQEGDEG